MENRKMLSVVRLRYWEWKLQQFSSTLTETTDDDDCESERRFATRWKLISRALADFSLNVN